MSCISPEETKLELAPTHSSLIFNTRESVLFFFNSRDLAAVSFPFLRSSTSPPCCSRKNSLDDASMSDPGRGTRRGTCGTGGAPHSNSSGASRGHASRSFERRKKKGSKSREKGTGWPRFLCINLFLFFFFTSLCTRSFFFCFTWLRNVSSI